MVRLLNIDDFWSPGGLVAHSPSPGPRVPPRPEVTYVNPSSCPILMKMVQLQGVCRLPKWMQGVIWLIYVTHIDVIDIYTNPYAIQRPIGWAPGTPLFVKFVIF